MVFTISGFVHKKSVKELQDLGLIIEYATFIKFLLVQDLKVVMYYVTNEMLSYFEPE